MQFTDTIKMLLSGSMKKRISAEAGDIIRLRNWGTNNDWTYYAQVRGYLTKMPALAYSDINPWPMALVSEEQYLDMMNDYATTFADTNCTENWAAINQSY